MFYYTAYGLTLESEISLPGFREIGVCKADISVARKYSQVPSACRPKRTIAERVTDGVLFTCPYGGLSYEILRGQEIIIHTNENNLSELERLPLYGFAIATILQQHGFFVLHASAVEIAGKAAVFVGGKTHGKSTLIASLVNRGHRLISDDVTAVVLHANKILVLPGIACIKLWPDAMEVFGIDAQDHPVLYSDTTKRNYFVPERFCSANRELNRIFMLDHGDQLGLQALNAVDKMLWLAGGSYSAKFQDGLSSGEKEVNFKGCAFLAKKARIVKLNRPRNLELLSITSMLVEEDIIAA